VLRTTKPPKCKVCKARTHAVGVLLHDACINEWVRIIREKKAKAMERKLQAARKNERKRDRARKEEMKTIPELIRIAQREFNAWTRERDKDKPCICCGRMETAVTAGHGWDAGHYRSTGSAPHLRFHEDNCHRQLVLCNRYGAGRAVDYRLGLIARIGADRVAALESDNSIRKWTREELRQIAVTYRQKLKDLKRSQDN
jgi:hypothetical protein